MTTRTDSGFTLLEVLVALTLLLVGLLAVAPMFVYAAKAGDASGHMGSAGAAAVLRMEQLRINDFESNALLAGGSLTTSETGYSDGSHPDFDTRWEILDNATPPTLKTIRVRVLATYDVLGAPQEITITALRAR